MEVTNGKTVMRSTLILIALVIIGCQDPATEPKAQMEKPSLRADFISRIEAKIVLLNASPGADKYQLFRSSGSDPYKLLSTVPPNQTSITDDTIEPGISYRYYVVGTAKSQTVESEVTTITYVEDPNSYTKTFEAELFEFSLLGNIRISADGSFVLLTRALGLQEIDFALADLEDNRGVMVMLSKLHSDDGALGLATSADGEWIATGNYKTGEVFMINAESLNTIQTLSPAIDGVYALQFSKDSKQLLVAGNSSEIISYSYKIDNWSESKSFNTECGVNCLKYSGNDSNILSAGVDNNVRLLDEEGIVIRTFTGHEGMAGDAIFSKDETHVLSPGYDDKKLIMWDTSTGEVEKTFTAAEGVTGVAITPHNTIMAGDASGIVSLLDENLQIIKSFDLGSGVINLDYHINKDFAAIYLTNGNVVILKNQSKWQVE
jgi:hypothetical protein